MSNETVLETSTERETVLPTAVHNKVAPRARLMASIGGLLTVAGAFLPWCYTDGPLGNVSLIGNPAPVQYMVVAVAFLAVVFVAASSPVLKRVGASFDVGPAVRAAGTGTTVLLVIVAAAIGMTTNALANLDYGWFVSLVGALLVMLAGYGYPLDDRADGPHPRIVGVWAALLLSLGVAAGFFVAVAAIVEKDPWVFTMIIGSVIAATTVVVRSEVAQWIGEMATDQRRVLMLATFVAAFSLPMTQGGSNSTMSVAVQVLIFAATAVGLNIVVGLAGLLDLGYIAFLGAGAYVGAILSGSAFSAIGWKPPFIVVVLIGMVVSGVLGLIIGSPTLRVSGDYLAIVTLAFGEIFRFAMLNLDGTSGPDITNGPDGIPAIPELVIFGFNFGESHTIAGFEITRYGNYYLLLLFIMALIVLVFSRLNESRIGRGWVAIREDEKAAEAMGVNVFGLKLLAFAGGATLAGLAGTVKAHVDTSVTPDQYMFLESAFLLAAVVLGGMGTVTGVVVGAVLLKLLPEKLRFFSEYRLLMFGVLLVVMMRFRPEGLIRVKRRHPADDYPDAVEAGKLRPVDEVFTKRGLK